MTVAPVAAGTATIAVTATDPGSNRSATQRFRVTVVSAAAVDYDADDDGLIEIRTLAQLDAVRHDLDGDGTVRGDRKAAYDAAFPDSFERMGCSADRCSGYELVADLDFDTNGSGAPDAGDAWWNDGAGWRTCRRAPRASGPFFYLVKRGSVRRSRATGIPSPTCSSSATAG